MNEQNGKKESQFERNRSRITPLQIKRNEHKINANWKLTLRCCNILDTQSTQCTTLRN